MRILVPLDGSGLSRNALSTAAAVIGQNGGQLVLLHAHWPGDPHDPGEAALEEETRRLREKGIDVAPERRSTPRDEETGRVIAAAASDLRVDLIVMTTHGRSGLGRWLFGSVAEQVIQSTDLPVLLIPVGLSTSWPAGHQPTVILALDGSTLAEEAIKPTGALARALDAEVVLVQVLAAGAHGEPDARSSLQAQEYLQGVGAKLQDLGVSSRILLRHGEPDRAISSMANELQALAIGIGTHSADTAKRSTLGSVAMGIVRRADIPVLLS